MSQPNSTIVNKGMEGLAAFLSEYSVYFYAFFAFVAVTVIIIFIINVGKLSQAGDNVIKRQQAIHGILVSGVCLAVLGSFNFILWIILAFFAI